MSLKKVVEDQVVPTTSFRQRLFSQLESHVKTPQVPKVTDLEAMSKI